MPQDRPQFSFIKLPSEPKVGRVSYFKVFSGKVKTGDELNNNANRGYERLKSNLCVQWQNREAVNELVAGDLGVVVKLKDSHTNNTLSVKGHDVEVEPIPFPEPRTRAAISTENKK